MKETLSSGGERCQACAPVGGQQCVMGKNHFGYHRLGGVEGNEVTFTWVVKCPEGSCDLHDHSVGANAGYSTCIYCGDPHVRADLAGASPEEHLVEAQKREQELESLLQGARKEIAHCKKDKDESVSELMKVVQEQDALINGMAENLGLELSGRFLYEHATKSIARDLTQLQEERAEMVKALKAAQTVLSYATCGGTLSEGLAMDTLMKINKVRGV